MKRSKYASISLAAAVSVAIAGCESPEPSHLVMKRTSFQTVEECAKAKIPVDVCADAYMAALAEHRRMAPTYASKEDCEADFVEGYCEVDSKQQYVPRLGGFELVASGNLTQSQEAQANALASSASSSGASSGGGSNDGFMTGLLIGNMLSSDGGRYYSEPVYRYRDSRGSYETSTIKRRIESRQPSSSAPVFSKAKPINNQSYSTNATSRPAKPAANVQVVSRGGLGNESAAKTGWSGSRSSGS